MDMESILVKTLIFLEDSGLMINLWERDRLSLKIILFLREVFLMVKKLDKDSSLMQVDRVMKDSGLKIK
jgi:hypothetical protein